MLCCYSSMTSSEFVEACVQGRLFLAGQLSVSPKVVEFLARGKQLSHSLNQSSSRYLSGQLKMEKHLFRLDRETV
jgi:hypothetical protein